ncbi:hypothetical protein BJ546DRAFT_222160 [Cryomyces antarcticus]
MNDFFPGGSDEMIYILMKVAHFPSHTLQTFHSPIYPISSTLPLTLLQFITSLSHSTPISARTLDHPSSALPSFIFPSSRVYVYHVSSSIASFRFMSTIGLYGPTLSSPGEESSKSRSTHFSVIAATHIWTQYHIERCAFVLSALIFRKPSRIMYNYVATMV